MIPKRPRKKGPPKHGKRGVARNRNHLLISFHANLADYITDAVIATDCHDRITGWNAAAQGIYGWQAEEVMGQSVAALFKTEYQDLDRQAIAEILCTQGTWYGEVIQSRRDGIRIPIRASISTIVDQKGRPTGFVNINRDLTEHKQAEEALRLAEANYRSIFENASVGIFQSTPDGQYRNVNSSMAKILGYDSPQELIASIKSIPQQIYADPGARWHFIEELRSKNFVERFEARNVRKDGTIIWTSTNARIVKDTSGETLYYEGFLMDITERKRAEEALRRSENKYRTLADFTYDWEFWQDPNGRFEYVSPACKRITGYSASEFKLNPDLFADIIHPDDKSGMAEHILQDRISREPHQFEFRIIARDGSERWIEHVCQSVYDDLGRWAGRRGSNRDITDRKLADEKIRKQLKELQRTEAELQRRNKELATLNQIGQTLNQLAEPAQILEQVFLVIGQVLDNRNLYIAIFDDAKQVISFPIYTIDGERRMDYQRPLGEGITDYIIRTNKPLLIKQDLEESLRRLGIQLIGTASRSFVGVPMRAGDQVVGVIALQDYQQENAYDEHDLELVMTIATQVTVALENAHLYSSVHQELNERRQAENALRESEEKYRNLFTEMLDGFALHEIICDEAGQPQDYRFVEVNPAFEKLTGLHRAELIGRTVREVLPNIESSWIERYGRVALTGEPVHFKEFTGSLGRYYEITAFCPHPNQFATIFMDITEHKRAEDALRESEERFSRAFQNAPVPMTMNEVETGRFIEVNTEAIRISGFRRENLIGRTSVEAGWFSQEDRNNMLAILRKDGRVRNMELTLHTKGGQSIDLLYFNELITISGKPHILAIAQDITERKRAEKLIQKRLDLMEYSASHTLAEVLQRTLDHVGDLTDSPLGFYHFVASDQETLTLQAWSTRTLNEFCKAAGSGFHYSIGEAGVWVDCVHTKRPVIHNDYASLAHRKGLPEGHADVVRELVVPILRDGSIVAILGVGNKPVDYTDADINMVTYFADVAWEIVERKRAEETLRLNVERYRAVVENQTEFIVRWKPDGMRTFVNEAYCRYFGITPEEALDTAFIPLVAEEDRCVVEEKNLRLTSGTVNIETDSHRVIKQDGSIGWQEWTDKAIRDESGALIEFQSVGRDITERKQAEQQLHLRLSELELLHESGIALSQTLDQKEIGQKVIEVLATHLNWHHAAVRVRRGDSDEVDLIASVQPRKSKRGQARLHSAITRVGQGLAGWVMQYGKPLRIHDLKKDPRYFPTFKGMKSGLYVPMRIHERTIGCISVESDQPVSFTEEDERLLLTLATQAAIAIDNSNLFAELQHSNEELAAAYNAAIEGWSQAMDLRDKETEGHSLRVRDLTLKLADRMGIDQQEQIHMRRGALLHDIGKLGVPDQILFKNASLSEEEWVLMRKHPTYAFEMLSSISYLWSAIDIPYCHHEKWDGTGYPRGLKGEEIPLAARIFAIVDVWDALTSDRPYRPAWTNRQALDYIREQSGKQFDPQVVEAFLKLIT